MPRLDRALDRLLEPELEPNAEVAQPRPGIAKLVVDHLSHACALLHRDQLLVAQVFERDCLAREPVLRRANEDHLVVEERLVRDGAVAGRRADDAELKLAPRDLLDDRLRVRDGEVDRDVGVRLGELAQEHRDDRAARAGRGTERELPAERPFRIAGDLVEELPLEREHPLGAAVEPVPRLGRLDASSGAVEQLLAEPVFERTDLLADGRLRDAEPLGSLGEALALDDGAKGRQLAGVHIRRAYPSSDPGEK